MGVQYSKDRHALLFGDGELEKASLTYTDVKGGQVTLPVQFNPAEYNISRTTKFKETNGNGKEAHPKSTQPYRPGLAELRASLILDTSTLMPDYQTPKSLDKYLNDSKELTKICQELACLTKINPTLHVQSKVTFSWGALEFIGYMENLTISYQMFNRSGYPVRVKVEIGIRGEEREVLNQIGANPNESPDRTKFRRLNQREELWMLADMEYHDVSCWKEIARENGILNPRKIDYTKRIKVPAL